MTAVFCHNADDRKAETWRQQLLPFEDLEFVVSDAAKGIAAAVEQIADQRREKDPSAPPLGHVLDLFHTTQEAERGIRHTDPILKAMVRSHRTDPSVPRGPHHGETRWQTT